MPDKPLTESAQDLADTEYDAERWARVGAARQSIPPITPQAPTGAIEGAEVGLTQKGTDNDSIVKREPEV